MFKSYAEMTEAERAEIDRQEDERESYKAAMSWDYEDQDFADRLAEQAEAAHYAEKDAEYHACGW